MVMGQEAPSVDGHGTGSTIRGQEAPPVDGHGTGSTIRGQEAPPVDGHGTEIPISRCSWDRKHDQSMVMGQEA